MRVMFATQFNNMCAPICLNMRDDAGWMWTHHWPLAHTSTVYLDTVKHSLCLDVVRTPRHPASKHKPLSHPTAAWLNGLARTHTHTHTHTQWHTVSVCHNTLMWEGDRVVGASRHRLGSRKLLSWAVSHLGNQWQSYRWIKRLRSLPW